MSRPLFQCSIMSVPISVLPSATLLCAGGFAADVHLSDFYLQSTILLAQLLGGCIGSVVLMFSIVTHELGHVLALQRYCRGIVTGITINAMSGLTHYTPPAYTSPKEEFMVGAAGPCTSALLAGIAMIGFIVCLSLINSASPIPRGVRIASMVFASTAIINTYMTLFNLLPLNGLDGSFCADALVRWVSNDKVSSDIVTYRIGWFTILLLAVTQWSLAPEWTPGWIRILILSGMQFRTA